MVICAFGCSGRDFAGGMLKPVLCCVAAIALLAAVVPTHSASLAGSDVAVRAQRDGETFLVEADWSVAASADEVWGVLTDYEHMAQILSSVDMSRIVRRDGNRLEVAQTSHGNVGLLHVSRDSVREVELTPKREIRSHLLKGDLKASDFTTRIAEEGGVSRVTVHGKFVAAGLAAAVLTVEAVETQTQRNFQELRSEILRRKSNEPAPACLLAKTCPQGSG
jgi:carbon monoxide dehydrogenase subunit G